MPSITHKKVLVGVDNPNKQVSRDTWNDTHRLTGTPNTVLGFDADGNAIDIDLVAAIQAVIGGESPYFPATGFWDDAELLSDAALWKDA